MTYHNISKQTANRNSTDLGDLLSIPDNPKASASEWVYRGIWGAVAIGAFAGMCAAYKSQPVQSVAALATQTQQQVSVRVGDSTYTGCTAIVDADSTLDAKCSLYSGQRAAAH